MLRDLHNELIGDATARNDYGVVIDRAAWRVDAAATEARRAELRAARAWTEPPAVSRGEMPVTGGGAPGSGGRAACSRERDAAITAMGFVQRMIAQATTVKVRDPQWGKWGGRIIAAESDRRRP